MTHRQNRAQPNTRTTATSRTPTGEESAFYQRLRHARTVSVLSETVRYRVTTMPKQRWQRVVNPDRARRVFLPAFTPIDQAFVDAKRKDPGFDRTVFSEMVSRTAAIRVERWPPATDLDAVRSFVTNTLLIAETF